MKKASAVIVVLALSFMATAQSGRRSTQMVTPIPPPTQEITSPTHTERVDEPPPVTAEKNQDYRCTDDGSLARIIDTEQPEPHVLSSKQVDSRVVINAKPQPSYTREARRLGVQGFVVLKTLLGTDGKVARVKVVRGLPAGLTESAIRASCKMKFKPAIKDGQPVLQWVIAEYVFRLSDSSIFTP